MTLALKDNPNPVFPEQLLVADTHPDPDHPWWVARTRTRQEKALARSLKGKGISYFLPLVPRPQKSKGRMRTSIIPLFSGYLFFQADPGARQEALLSGHLAQTIPVSDQNLLHAQLQAIAALCSREATLELTDFVPAGRRVRIIGGPFKGLEGIVRGRKNTGRIVLNVDAIGQAVAVDLNVDQIQQL